MRLVATAEGQLQRRWLQVGRAPQCVAFQPHELASRQSDLGALDYAALPVVTASESDSDPLERERIRQLIERYGGDRLLLTLSDEELEAL